MYSAGPGQEYLMLSPVYYHCTVFKTIFSYNFTISLFPGHQTGAECCGSRIDFGNDTSPTGAFQRVVAGPSFYLFEGVSPPRDLAPPSRVADLRLLDTASASEDSSLAIQLAWTAPGGDLDQGKGEC